MGYGMSRAFWACLLAFLQVSCAQNDLIAWYMFNGTGSTVLDYGPNKHHATAYNNPTFHGLFAEFDSSTSAYVELPPSFGTAMSTVTSFASTCWVKIRTFKYWMRLWDLGSGDTNYMMFQLTGYNTAAPYMAYETLKPGYSKQLTGTVDNYGVTNTWYLVGLSYDASVGNVTLFLNGVAITRPKLSQTTVTPAMIGSFTKAYIGRSQFAADAYLDAYVRDMRFYSRTLSVTEARAIHTAGASIRNPTQGPTQRPTVVPTTLPSQSPTQGPTRRPTLVPTAPTQSPTQGPTTTPTQRPTTAPTLIPTTSPSLFPTQAPTREPTTTPSAHPTITPSHAPTRAPTVTPTLHPTQPPTQMPTAVPVTIRVQSPWHHVGSNTTRLVSRGSNLQLYGSASGLGFISSYTYNWSTSNASTLAGPCFVPSGPYLTLPSRCLSEGGSYVLRLLVARHDGLSGDATIMVYVNRAPIGGNCSAMPTVGRSLSTSVSLVCLNWVDKEAHYPLSYSFAAVRPNSFPTTLSGILNVSAFQTLLPSGENLTLTATITDMYDGRTLTKFGPVNMTTPHAGVLQSLFNQTAVQASSSNHLDSTALPQALLVVEEMAASGNHSATGRVLDVLQDITLSQTTMSLDTAYSIVNSLLSIPDTLTSMQAMQMLTLAGQVANYTIGMTESLGDALLAIVEKATAALQAGQGVVISGITKTSIAGLSAGIGTTYTSAKTRLRLDLYVRSPPSTGIFARPFPQATVEVPGPTIDSVSHKLCSSLVLVRTVHRTLDGSDARPWLNSSAPLLANLTTFQLCTVCKGVVIELTIPSNKTTRVKVALSVKSSSRMSSTKRVTPQQGRRKLESGSATTVRTAACPSDGQQRLISATCRYASGLNVTTKAICDGNQAAVSYQCPVLPRCVRWDTAGGQWSPNGCQTVSLSALGGAKASLSCHCSQMGTLSATTDTAVEAITTLSVLSRQTGTGRTYSLLVLLTVVYTSLIAALLILRLKRVTESLAYIRRVPSTRMFRTMLDAITPREGRPKRKTCLLDENQADDIGTDRDATVTDMERILSTIIQRRLQKIEGLRVYLRRSFSLCWRGGGVVLNLDPAVGGCEAMRSPITRLNAQQSVLMGFVRFCTQLVLAVITVGPNPQPLLDSITWALQMRLSWSFVMDTAYAGLRQSITIEPVVRFLELLLYMANKETSVAKSVAEMVVDRNLPLIVPKRSDVVGDLCIPLLRLSLLQLELIALVVDMAREGTGNVKNVEGTNDGQAPEGLKLSPELQIALKALVHVQMTRVHAMLREETQEHRQKMVQELEVEGTRSCRLLTRRCLPYAELRGNPLDSFDLEPRMARRFDDWVTEHLFFRPVGHFAERIYYRLFVADGRSQGSTLDHVLFSWRLLVIDLVLMVYLLGLFGILLRVRVNITATVVENAMLNLAIGILLNWLLISPMTSYLQGLLTRRIMTTICEDILTSSLGYLAFYEETKPSVEKEEKPIVPLAPYADVKEASELLRSDVAEIVAANAWPAGLPVLPTVEEEPEPEGTELPPAPDLQEGPWLKQQQDEPSNAGDGSEWDHGAWVSSAVDAASNAIYHGRNKHTARRRDMAHRAAGGRHSSLGLTDDEPEEVQRGGGRRAELPVLSLPAAQSRTGGTVSSPRRRTRHSSADAGRGTQGLEEGPLSDITGGEDRQSQRARTARDRDRRRLQADASEGHFEPDHPLDTVRRGSRRTSAEEAEGEGRGVFRSSTSGLSGTREGGGERRRSRRHKSIVTPRALPYEADRTSQSSRYRDREGEAGVEVEETYLD